MFTGFLFIYLFIFEFNSIQFKIYFILFIIYFVSYLTMKKQHNLEAYDLLAYASPEFMSDYAEEVRALTCFTDYDLRNTASIFV